MPPFARVRARAAMVAVPASQVSLALSGYLVLAAAGRTTPVTVFTAVSAFYLLLNTVGRGVFAAVELELTRAVAAARAVGDPGRRAAVALWRRTLGLVLAAVVLVLAAVPLLSPAVGGRPAVIGLLVLGAVVMAASYFVRGPLAALGRYRAYSTTFLLEALGGVVGAAVLVAAGVDDALAWCAVFVVAPLVACVVVGAAVLRRPLRARLWSDARASPGHEPHEGRVTTSGLLWSTVLFLCSQGVWNLGAVVVAARSVAVPTVAAGFAAIAVLLRAPVLVFPAVQALLLPATAAEAERGGRGLLAALARRWAVPIALVAVAWMVVALLVLPPLTRLVFGLATVPSPLVIGLLAASALAGASVQLVQTHLIARNRHRRVALAWLAALVVLVLVGFAPIEPTLAGGCALAAAVGVAGLGMAGTRGPTGADVGRAGRPAAAGRGS